LLHGVAYTNTIFTDAYVVVTANCLIEVLAFGGNHPPVTKYGYVKLNGDIVWQSAWNDGTIPNLRGVHIITVNPYSCSLHVPSRQFDTAGVVNAGTELANYLQQIGCGTIIVASTADTTPNYLSDAVPTLKALGADVEDVQYRGAFAFVAQKAFASKTVLRKAVTEADALNNKPNIVATVTGKRQVSLFRVNFAKTKGAAETDVSCCDVKWVSWI